MGRANLDSASIVHAWEHTVKGQFARLVVAGLVACLLPVGAVLARSDTASNLLEQIQEAARTLDYKGVFAYQNNGQMQAYRITHRYRDGNEQERLEVLDNVQREFHRHNDVVHCLIPDRELVLIESRGNARFPGLLMASGPDFSEHYQLTRSEKPGRIAGRSCVRVDIVPKDNLRPQFRLCADESTGLLLKAQVLEPGGRISQQVAFTQVEIGVPISDEEFVAPWDVSGWKKVNREPVAVDLNAMGWRYVVPDGYQISQQARRLFQDGREVDQIILTDGLANISIFIEPYQENLSQHHSTGPRHIGSVNLYGKRVGDDWVMIVGEVPAATVQIVADSINRVSE
ncbi:siderophore-interacting protein [Orrella marina]|uniref:Siderophore-interacting protein n=1 Tax=Orrella marina TaxID=2163011 RepID=A0A2R4XIZ2_9BURK|nr:siderophore-interacting protein [Orrella marina]